MLKSLAVLGSVATVVAVAVVGLPSFRADELLERTPMLPSPGIGRTPDVRGPIYPIPYPNPDALDPDEVALGRRLFHDTILSDDRTISCASCHDIASGGDDGLALSVGVHGAVGDRNAPTVLNSSLNFRQFWDGRAQDLEEQVEGPILNPVEMNMTWPRVMERLRDDARYVEQFRTVYGTAPTVSGVKKAIAAFESSLITPDSPFDSFLRGDENAISDAAKRGYETFVSVGCATCHQGVNVGGNMFQPLGHMRAYLSASGEEMPRSVVFKVPSLRNVALTAPYFHDGSVPDLETSVRRMAEHQLGILLEERDIQDIVSFLESLTGNIPGEWLD